MEAAELRGRLADLGLSQASFARALTEQTGHRYDRRHIHRWTSGARPVPGLVAALVRAWCQVEHAPAPAWVSLEPTPLATVRRLLDEWGHSRGYISRPIPCDAHVLRAHGRAVALTVTSELVHPPIAGNLYRDDAVELARLCSADPAWTRVALRVWREAVWPPYRRKWAITYVEDHVHTGDTFRFDGWRRLARVGPAREPQTGRKTGPKTIYGWCRDKRTLKARAVDR